MHRHEELWYRVGYALEEARQRLPRTEEGAEQPARRGKPPAKPGKPPTKLGKPPPKRGKPPAKPGKPPTKPGKPPGRGMLSLPLDAASHRLLDALLTVGAGTVAARLLALWPGRGRPGIFRLLRAGAAGAAAAFLAELLRPALKREPPPRPLEEELTDILLSGAGRGLLYATVVDPRLPGPPLLRGTAYGALEYALAPWGGLEELTGSAAPHRKVPVLSLLLQRLEGEEEALLSHLAFGIALALLYDR